MSDEPWVPERWRGKSAAKLWSNMLLKDHGLVKVPVPNRHRVSAIAFRSAQPLPYHLAAWKRRGLKSVVNLRGPSKRFASYTITRRACERLGLAFHDFMLRSRDAPHREELLGLLELFDRLDYPVLFYCKSGADRSGLVAALFLIHREGRSVAEAQRSLSLRYMHVKSAKPGILGCVLEDFSEFHRKTGGDLRTFAQTAYDAEAIRARFRMTGVVGWVAEKLMRRE